MPPSSSSPYDRARRLAPALLSIVVALPAREAAAQTGSGTVAIDFIRYSGPIALTDPQNVNDPLRWSPYGTVNGQRLGMDTHYPVSRNPNGQVLLEEVRGSTSFLPPFSPTASGPRSVSLVEHQCCGQPAEEENLISFTARPFTNVAKGQDFVLGTLTFKNGIWFGNDDPGVDRKTYLEFRIRTTSPNGPAFNQSIFGNIVMKVHAIDRSLCNTQAGREAEADWVYISGVTSNVLQPPSAFRVYDSYCLPPGYTNVGSVDLVGQFNSLDIVGFTNPQGGFLTSSTVALPTPQAPPPPVTTPEPATWALLGGGLAALEVCRRRPRLIVT
jgi:hypothetical protein